jgi:hypothetical protein
MAICRLASTKLNARSIVMELIATQVLPIAAAGYSLVYLLGGGGIFGAIVIFIIAKMLGK